MQAAGGQAAAIHVGQPKKPWFLPTNYRTHAGILGAAAAVVDVLRDQFSQVFLPFHFCCLALSC